MRRRRRKRCEFCGDLYLPDPRVGDRQRACHKADCRRARALDSKRRWREQNPEKRSEYYRLYVKPARQRDPEMQRRYRRRKKEREPSPPEDAYSSLSDCVQRTSAHISSPISIGREIGDAIEALLVLLPRVMAALGRGEIGDEKRPEILNCLGFRCDQGAR